MSMSYGECEAENGASANALHRSHYQQAVAEGISVFVAAGDEGAASCDAGSASGARTASASAASPPRLIMSPSAAPISAIPATAPTPTTGARPTAPTMPPLCPTFRKFRGTIPAPARCLRAISGSPPPMALAGSAAAPRRERRPVGSGRGQRRAEQLRHRSAFDLRHVRRHLPGIRETVLAGRTDGHPDRRRARHSGCFSLRRRRRRGDTI